MLFKFILTIKPLHLIERCCSNTYKYKLLSGGQLSGGKKYPTVPCQILLIRGIRKLFLYGSSNY